MLIVEVVSFEARFTCVVGPSQTSGLADNLAFGAISHHEARITLDTLIGGRVVSPAQIVKFNAFTSSIESIAPGALLAFRTVEYAAKRIHFGHSFDTNCS